IEPEGEGGGMVPGREIPTGSASGVGTDGAPRAAMGWDGGADMGGAAIGGDIGGGAMCGAIGGDIAGCEGAEAGGGDIGAETGAAVDEPDASSTPRMKSPM